MNLEKLRIKIDECNKELINVLKKRFELTRQIGNLKAENNLPPCDKTREKILIDKMKIEAINNGLNEKMVEQIFETIMKTVVNEHKEIRKQYKNDSKKNK